MVADPAQLYARLDQLAIPYTILEHPPVLTVEEADRHTGYLPGGHCKSLFLKDRKGGLWLLVCEAGRRLDVNRLAKVIGSPRLSFGKAALLIETLGVAPGAVTPFALINDPQQRVRPLLDRAMLAHDRLNYHPLVNTATITVASADLLRFVEACGHEVRVVDLDAGKIMGS